MFAAETRSPVPCDARRAVLRAAAVLAALVACAYAPVVFLARGLHPALYEPLLSPDANARAPYDHFKVERETSAYYEFPVDRLVGRLWRETVTSGAPLDFLPLWNPYQGLGVPLLAQYSTRVCFPYQILQNVCPVAWTDLFLLGRAWLAGLGTYLFLRRLPGMGDAPALLGGTAYMLSGAFVWFFHLEQMTNVAFVLPWLMWSVEALAAAPGRRRLAGCGLGVGGTLLAGQPEVALVALILAAAYFVLRHPARDALRRLPWLTAAVLTGLALAAIQWIPFLESVREAHTLHPAGGDVGRRFVSWKLAPLILFPNVNVRESVWRFFPSNGIWDFLGGFCGVLPAFLAVAGIGAARREGGGRLRLLLFFLGSAAFWLLKNFGCWPFVEAGRLPLLDQTWTPRWAGPVWTFALACAAAVGAGALWDEAAPRGRLAAARWAGILSALAGTAALGAAAAALRDPSVLRLSLLYTFAPLAGALAVLAWILKGGARSPCAWTTVVFCELALAVPLGYHPAFQMARLAPFALGLAAACALARGRRRTTGILAAGGVALALAIDAVSPRGLPDRGVALERWRGSCEPPLPDGAERTRFRCAGYAGALFPNKASASRKPVHDVHLITALCPTRWHRFYQERLRDRPLGENNALWFTGIPEARDGATARLDVDVRPRDHAAVSVRWILMPTPGGAMRLRENGAAAPRARFASRVLRAEDWRQAQDRSGAAAFDPSREAVVEEEIALPPAEDESDAFFLLDRPNRVTLAVRTASRALLVLADLDFPGWRADINGTPVSILRVNGLVRGVIVPPGRHVVTFRYRPASVLAGAALSLTGFLACALLARR